MTQRFRAFAVATALAVALPLSGTVVAQQQMGQQQQQQQPGGGIFQPGQPGPIEPRGTIEQQGGQQPGAGAFQPGQGGIFAPGQQQQQQQPGQPGQQQFGQQQAQRQPVSARGIAGVIDVATANFPVLNQALVAPQLVNQLVRAGGQQQQNVRVVRLSQAFQGTELDVLRDAFNRSNFLQRNAQLSQQVLRNNQALQNALQQQNVQMSNVVALDVLGRPAAVYVLEGLQVRQAQQQQGQVQPGQQQPRQQQQPGQQRQQPQPGAQPGQPGQAAGILANVPLAITGVQLNPQDPTIQLQNLGGQVLDLSGFRIAVGNVAISLPAGLRINPGEFVTLHLSRGTGDQDDVFLGDEAFTLLSQLRPGAQVTIRSDQGNVIAQFTVPQF